MCAKQVLNDFEGTVTNADRRGQFIETIETGASPTVLLKLVLPPKQDALPKQDVLPKRIVLDENANECEREELPGTAPSSPAQGSSEARKLVGKEILSKSDMTLLSEDFGSL